MIFSVFVSRNFRENESIEFLPDFIQIRKSEHVETRETRKYGNIFLSHCLSSKCTIFLTDLIQLQTAGMENLNSHEESQKFKSLIGQFKQDVILYITEAQTIADAKGMIFEEAIEK